MDVVENERFKIRRANANDMESVKLMIQELASFENMSEGPALSTEDLIRDAGLKENSHEFFHCYIAEAKCSEHNSNAPSPYAIGYAICFFSYSTWKGKSYFMEDIYVRPEFRGLGVGRLIIETILQYCKHNSCKRLDFHVLAWNPARKFYEKIGAVDLTESEDWHFYRININDTNLLSPSQDKSN